MKRKKTRKISPTVLTLRMFRELGYLVDKSEQVVPHSFIKKDLFGWCDAVALKDHIVGLQATSRSNMSARQKKIDELDSAVRWLQAGGGILVVGWYQKGGKKGRPWLCRVAEGLLRDGKIYWESWNERGGRRAEHQADVREVRRPNLRDGAAP